MNKNAGFTLIEILVVMVILGIMATLIVPKIMSRPEQARIIKAKQDILTLESALDIYRLDNGFYPSTDQGLDALVRKPDSEPVPANWKAEGYLQHLPKDPWGHAYQYINNDGKLHIFSYGPKGTDTEGEGSISNENNGEGSE